MYVELVSRCHYYSSIIFFLTVSPLVEQNRNVKSRLLILVSAFLSEKLLENIWNNIRGGFFLITFPLVKNYKPQNTRILHEPKSVAAQYSAYIWK